MPRKIPTELTKPCACGDPTCFVVYKHYKRPVPKYRTPACYYEHAKVKAQQRLIDEQKKWN